MTPTTPRPGTSPKLEATKVGKVSKQCAEYCISKPRKNQAPQPRIPKQSLPLVVDAGFGVGRAVGVAESFPAFVDRPTAAVDAEHYCMKCCTHKFCGRMRRVFALRTTHLGSRQVDMECRTYDRCRHARRRRFGLRPLEGRE